MLGEVAGWKCNKTLKNTLTIKDLKSAMVKSTSRFDSTKEVVEGRTISSHYLEKKRMRLLFHRFLLFLQLQVQY
jgi:hypothetical protein